MTTRSRSHAPASGATRGTPRRLAGASVAGFTALALLAGCTGGREAEETPETLSAGTSTAEATPTPEVPDVETGDLDADLASLVSGWYRGEDVAVGEAAQGAADERVTSAGTVELEATTGNWNGAEVAVVVHEDDVTLAVSADEESDDETDAEDTDGTEEAGESDERGEWTIVGGWWPSMDLEDPALGEDARHLLFLGADAREKEGESITNTRADAIQMVGIDGEGGGGIVGVPRDMWVEREGGSHSKINAALVFDGPEGMQQAVTNLSDIEFDGYVLTGFEGFQAIVDDMGGLPVDAPVHVERDDKVVPVGESVMDAVTALMYVRERKTLPGGDFDRSFHQGIALLGFAGRALDEGPQALATSLDLVDPHVETNVEASDMLTFAAWLYHTDITKVGHTVPDAPFGTSSDGQSILVNDEGVQEVFEDFSDGRLNN
ncbi:LCP family protein [Brevibacterium litoralis]|uniref:LCP family protein n=1 Tax=Brevibacterium litoralis TaxID=3138935 RepID=UPI0032F05E4C